MANTGFVKHESKQVLRSKALQIALNVLNYIKSRIAKEMMLDFE
jgi:hypothetical protein